MELRSDDDAFSRALVMKLIDELETEPLPHLTPNEHAHLLVLIQTTLEVCPGYNYSLPLYTHSMFLDRRTTTFTRCKWPTIRHIHALILHSQPQSQIGSEQSSIQWRHPTTDWLQRASALPRYDLGFS